ncbi:MAG: sugar phosphate isomerase/epimerase [Spirochaetaceae bacterium]|jgi:sugar phosphate isomerase/epimerase|nr:sugar phosphate isomerase/epimerase [Spirochaetaceae bacterium]
MYKIKQSMDSVNYGGYFHTGGPLDMKQIIDKAAGFGYEAVDIWPHRPLMSPQDWNRQQRKDLLAYASDRGIQFAALDACTNFMRPEHILAPRYEKEIAYLRECCELAVDMNCHTVRILPAFIGYFWGEYYNKGYCQTAMQSRTLEVSTQDDYLREWESVRQGIHDAGLMAKQFDVVLALQGHPPVINCVADLFDMVDEVGLDNIGFGLDLPLFDHPGNEEFIVETVRRAGKKMFHSHTLGNGLRYGPCDVVYATEEVVPGDGLENWIPFFKTCKEIEYKGYFAYEQCAPFLVKGHKKPDVAVIDARQKKGFDFIKSLEEKIS